MKTITSNYVRQLLLAFAFVLTLYGTANGQTSTYLSWNKQVSCITYGSTGEPDDDRKKLEFLDSIYPAKCIKVCPNTTVSYSVTGDNIANVLWSVTGAPAPTVSGTNGINASVTWGATGSGALDVTVIYTDNTQRTMRQCIEIVNGPNASFKVVTPDEAAEFCLLSPINFENTSNDNGGSEIVSYMWYFEDGETSSEFEPTYAYSTSGWKSVQLKVTNSCGCSSYFEYPVYIHKDRSFNITCASVTCEDEHIRETYTADSDCGGDWVVTGGSIADKTATTVTVIWDNVPDSGFGYVSFRPDCACTFWTTVKIPVVKKVGNIVGNAAICQGGQGLFKLPQWPATNYIWGINPINSGADLVYNDQRNEIIVNGLLPGEYTLSCKYTNLLLGCMGSASLKITVSGNPEITANQPNAFCTNSGTKTYTSVGNQTVIWKLKYGSSVIQTSSGTSFSYNFTQGGTYTLTATSTSAGSCTSEPIVINVTGNSATPNGAILGNDQICTGVPYQYSLVNTVPNTIFIWDVLPAGAGTFEGSNTGNDVTLKFTAAVTQIRVKRISLNGLACESGWLTKNISHLVLNPILTANQSVHCRSSQSTFSLNLGGITPDHIEWSVTNGGGVVYGTGGTGATIAWNENGGQQTVTVKVRKCNVEVVKTITVTVGMPPATPRLNVEDDTLCVGNELIVSIDGLGVGSTGTITWNFGNGTIQTTPIDSGGSYYFPSTIYNNTTANSITYTITAYINYVNGCNYSSVVSGTVTIYPQLLMSIAPGYSFIVCPTNAYSQTLTANVIAGTGVNVTYQWYKRVGTVMNQIAGATNSSYTVSNTTQGTNPQGEYYLLAIDSNGCSAFSSPVYISAACLPTNPCELSPAPVIDLTANWQDCNSFTTNLSYTGSPVVQWLGATGLTLGASNANSATYTINSPHTAKAYYITVNLKYGGCIVQKTVEVRKNYKPDFKFATSCISVGGGYGIQYNINLINNTALFDVSGPVTYTYSGPGITTQTGQTITVTNLPAGTYNYTLAVSMPGRPTCTITKPITLAPKPDTDFTILDNYVCAEEGITLNITNYNPAYRYEFIYAGVTYVASSATTSVNFDGPSGNYPIQLKVTPAGGCSFSAIKYINYTKATYTGTINVTPGEVVCEGSFPVLSYAGTSSPAPYAYAWMHGNMQVGSSATYTPTASGVYWLKLKDYYGCEYNDTGYKVITIRQRPYAGIVGNTDICHGEEGVVQGVVAGDNIEYRWLINGSPMPAPYGTWGTTTPLTLNVPSATGIYNYKFEVRPLGGDTSCTSSAEMSVMVHPQITLPTITYSIIQCEPYVITVTASGPSNGVYNWSNGMVGQTITVDSGGLIGVTYTSPTGCKIMTDAMLPQPIERSLWIFPSGCFTMCPSEDPELFLLGPLGNVNSYNWLVNGIVPPDAHGTNEPVDKLQVLQLGSYQLSITQGICTVKSDIMHIIPNLEECDYTTCDLVMQIDDVKIGETYMLKGFIHNPTGNDITVNFSSLYGYGTFNPSSVTIAAGDTFYFNYDLELIPNGNYEAEHDIIILQTEDCSMQFPVKYSEGYSSEGLARNAVMALAPNPAEDVTSVSYDLGDDFKQAESLSIYNMLGNAVYETRLSEPKGDVKLPLSALPSGTYIVSIKADGTRALQQTLIKK